ncbi:sensor histidine kinase [Spirochaeta isovalerica]|uniref:histidine kinase n=1 Tax=Spirochaeta isovalerica TaxID=150 RepID=A0A841R7B2_9SPIO|nr:sensor histidine kinase [Spirochaeta isovalerica]MBB6478869.1 signal transduction histidine kinase [Spirochaeta isovalerica]
MIETRKTEKVVFLFSLVIHLTSPLLFVLRGKSSPLSTLYFPHFLVFLGISLLLSFIIFLYRSDGARITIILIRFMIIYFIGYPLGDYIGIEILLFSSLILESGLLLPIPANSIFLVLENLVFLMIQREFSAWWYDLEAVPVHDLIFTFLFNSLFSTLVYYLAYNIEDRRRKEKKIERLDSAISQLTDANIGFQKYVKEKELETIVNERKRLSREIHDAVGYALTNIIMLLEAAALLVDKDRSKQKEAILNAKKQAINGLEETRTALRHLREDKEDRLQGKRAIDELIRAFRDATGIVIKVEYGNLPFSVGERVDTLMFRMIQEGMTNAFRHGMATVITIIFWVDEDLIRLSIHDNGSGSSDIVEGIGLAGMRERLEQIGGRLLMKNVVDGFELSAEIPLEEDK